ncbi:MAG: Uma2 family endonuclease [Geminicoccaceae bacterium]
MATPAPKRMTLAEFLEWDDGTDTIYELIDGQAVAMAPPRDAHGTIVMNLGLAIGPGLQPPCRIVGNAGITRPERADSFYVADLVVTCDQPADQRFFLPEPRLIVEVLSRSTAAHDRGRKGEEYRRIPSVPEILFVFSDEKRLELWRREGERWVIEDHIGEATVRLESLKIDLPLSAIYASIALD